MYRLHATAESEPNTKWPKEDLQLHRCEQRLWGIFLTPVRTSTFLFQSYWLVIGKGRKVAELKTSKHKAFDPHSLKRHSPSSLMCQDNRNWIFYKSSIWKPIKLSCGNDGLLPGGLLSDKLAFNACAVQCCILKYINVNVEFLLINRFYPFTLVQLNKNCCRTKTDHLTIRGTLIKHSRCRQLSILWRHPVPVFSLLRLCLCAYSWIQCSLHWWAANQAFLPRKAEWSYFTSGHIKSLCSNRLDRQDSIDIKYTWLLLVWTVSELLLNWTF